MALDIAVVFFELADEVLDEAVAADEEIAARARELEVEEAVDAAFVHIIDAAGAVPELADHINVVLVALGHLVEPAHELDAVGIVVLEILDRVETEAVDAPVEPEFCDFVEILAGALKGEVPVGHLIPEIALIVIVGAADLMLARGCLVIGEIIVTGVAVGLALAELFARLLEELVTGAAVVEDEVDYHDYAAVVTFLD